MSRAKPALTHPRKARNTQLVKDQNDSRPAPRDGHPCGPAWLSLVARFGSAAISDGNSHDTRVTPGVKFLMPESGKSSPSAH